MSPQPSSIDNSPVDTSGTRDSIVFGDNLGSAVEIPKALITHIWGHVREGIRSLTRGGLEVGGLLLGPKVSGGRVVVEAIIPLPIEYRQGPSFLMSASDLATIAPAMERARSGGAKVVVGFYRSRTRGEETLRESDFAILQAIERAHPSYRDDFRCCVILAPKSLSAALACVTLRDDDGWTDLRPATLQTNPVSIVASSSSTPLQQAPRNPRAEEKAAEVPAPVSNVIQMGEQRLPEHREVLTAPPQHRTGRERLWRYGAAVVVAAAGIWTLTTQLEKAPSATPQAAPRAHLGFSATRDGPVWKLTWDRAAIDALNPVGGVLSIDDGVYEQQVPLATPDLASGTLFYTPQSGNLTFSLRIDRGGSHVEEHVRVLAAPSMDPAPANRDQPDASKTAARVNPAPTPKPANPSPESPAPAATPSNELPVEVRAPRNVKEFRIPVSQSSKAAPPNPAQSAVEAPPGVETVAMTPPRPAPLTLAIPIPPAPEPRPAAEVAATASPAPQTAATPPATSPATTSSTPPSANTGTAVIRTPTAAATRSVPPPATLPLNYVAPKPIQQARPQLPANMPSGVTQVQVVVDIDARGRVIQATPVGWSGANAPLMVWAVRAVTGWVFEPARLDGKAVPSQMNLIFKF